MCKRKLQSWKEMSSDERRQDQQIDVVVERNTEERSPFGQDWQDVN